MARQGGRVRLDLTIAEATAYDLAAGNSYQDADYCAGFATGRTGAALTRAVKKMRAAIQRATEKGEADGEERLPGQAGYHWKLFVAPSVGVAAESGADRGDSLVTGGIAWASYRFSPSLTLGLGAGVFSKPEEVSAFPLIIVDWKITDRLRLANPLQAGPTGPAGLELSYTFNDFTIAAGGAYRSARFRLDDHGSIPDGVGEDKAVPIWARFSAKLGKSGTVGLYGGAMVGGKMTIEDSSGHEISDESYDASPFLAATFSLKF